MNSRWSVSCGEEVEGDTVLSWKRCWWRCYKAVAVMVMKTVGNRNRAGLQISSSLVFQNRARRDGVVEE